MVTRRVTKRRVWSALCSPPCNIFLFKKNKCRPSCPSRPNALNSMRYAGRLAVQCRPSRPKAGQGVGRRWCGACSRAFTRPFMQLASSVHGTLVGAVGIVFSSQAIAAGLPGLAVVAGFTGATFTFVRTVHLEFLRVSYCFFGRIPPWWSTGSTCRTVRPMLTNLNRYRTYISTYRY